MSKKGTHGTKPYDRSWDNSLVDQLPGDFDIISDTDTHTGLWNGIMVWEPAAGMFGANGFKVKGTTKDMSNLDNNATAGMRIPGRFTQIVLGNADAVIIAFKR